MQAVSHLLSWGVVDINFKNLEGKTAWDILEGQTQVNNTEMRVMLRRAGASTGSSLSTVTTYQHYLRRPKNRFLERQLTSHAREVANFSDGKRNALLVIATLFVTVTYQAVLSPPGGLWQDDYKPETNQTLCNLGISQTLCNLGINQTLCNLETNYTLCNLGINQTHSNTTAPHKAGTAIGMGRTHFRVFLAVNFVVFMISITVLALLIPFDEINAVFRALIPCVWICYFDSLIIITDGPTGIFYIAFIMFYIYFFILNYVSVLMVDFLPIKETSRKKM